jgi:hypothetical protein
MGYPASMAGAQKISTLQNNILLMQKLISSLPMMLHLAGVAQILLALFSIAIPFVLKWKEEMKKVNGLIRNIFYTYSVYIFAINVWFGIVSACMPFQLSNKSGLAAAVTLFIALYWLGRVLVQFSFGKAAGRPVGLIFTLGEIALWLLFIVLTFVYGLAAAYNLNLL